MKKYNRRVVLILIIIAIVIGFNIYINATDKEITGGALSSHWLNEDNKNIYLVNIDKENGFAKSETNYFANIGIKKRKSEIDIKKAEKLGNPNHDMVLYLTEKHTGISDGFLDFNIWLYKDEGYIQPRDYKDTVLTDLSKISKLEDEEHKFLVKVLLKYHDEEDIFKK